MQTSSAGTGCCSSLARLKHACCACNSTQPLSRVVACSCSCPDRGEQVDALGNVAMTGARGVMLRASLERFWSEVLVSLHH